MLKNISYIAMSLTSTMKQMVDNMADLKLTLNLKGIGPHKDTTLEKSVSSINMAIFAENGSGKSFISKSFKRISDLKNIIAGNDDELKLKEKTSAMIRFGETKGNMQFGISNSNIDKKINVIFEKDALPKVEDNTDFIYHVFNSEYIKENLESVNYKPEDNVSGFILGKVNIDLTKEKDLLKQLFENIEKTKLSIDEIITKGKQELKDLRIQSNTTEFINITYENIKLLEKVQPIQGYSLLKEKYIKLLNMPADTLDITPPTLPDKELIKELLNTVCNILLKSYTLSNFAEEFKQNVKSKQPFIERGLELSDGESCPFCGQTYSNTALNLIDEYNSFLQNEEAKITNALIAAEKKIENYITSFENYITRYQSVIKEYNSLKIYFPSLEDTELKKINIIKLLDILKEIIAMLILKKENISNSHFAIKEKISELFIILDEIIETENVNSTRIDFLNKNKNDINKERLTLRKNLCNAKFNSIIDDTKNNFDEINKLMLEQEKLQQEIQEKENLAKIDRRKMLINELKQYLSLFFADKYDFDETNFCISFQNKALIKNTEDVLSDGEKSILAFCFYLANIHGIVEKEEDYNRILFVIDDPVSSMDFNYVYNVAQVIRNLKNHANIKDRYVRYIILTHNMEFMSILVRNKIVSKKFILSQGKFEDFKDNYVMPYTWNLIDIYKAAKKEGMHKHTLPNSIRHVLETVYHFEGSKGVVTNFEEYISNNDILNQNGNLYSLINDHSHGAIRTSNGFTDKMLVDACKTVIEFINDKFPGQIKEIKMILGEMK